MAEPIWQDAHGALWQGDVRAMLAALPAASVQCVVTSPPYWGLRAYGTAPQVWGGAPDCAHEWATGITPGVSGGLVSPKVQIKGAENFQIVPSREHATCRVCGGWSGELGSEPVHDCNGAFTGAPCGQCFICHLVEVFAGVWRVLRPDGVLFVNLGDSYAGSGKGPAGSTGVNSKQSYWSQDTSGVLRTRLSSKVRPFDERWADRNRPAAPHTHCAEPSCGARLGSQHGESGHTSGVAPSPGLKAKDLCGLPWRFALAMQAAGWWLRGDYVWCLSGGTRVYARTQKGDMPITVKDLARLRPETVQLWNGERWTPMLGMSETPREDAIEITLRSGERIGCTPHHEWPTQRGLVPAGDLRVGDVLQTTRLPSPGGPRRAFGLDDKLVGWFVGLYLAEGSRGKHGAVLQIASHEREVARFERLREVADAYDGSLAVHVTSAHGVTANLYGRVLGAIMDTYIAGSNAGDKRLRNACWRRSDTFLRALLQGWLDGDGHYDAKNDRWRLSLTRNYALEADLRTLCARLGVSVRLKLATARIGDREYPTFRGQLRFSPSDHFNTRPDGEVVALGRSKGRKFWHIGVADEPHLFALASGVLTANSKPNPMPESVPDRCTRSHEYVFHFSKAARYYWDAAAIAETAIHAGQFVQTNGNDGLDAGYDGHRTRDGLRRGVEVGPTRNARSVWTIPTAPFPEAHFATYPRALVRRCVLAASREGDVVLDPFAGSGTTLVVARALGRIGWGIELQPDYVQMALKRLPQGVLL